MKKLIVFTVALVFGLTLLAGLGPNKDDSHPCPIRRGNENDTRNRQSRCVAR